MRLPGVQLPLYDKYTMYTHITLYSDIKIKTLMYGAGYKKETKQIHELSSSYSCSNSIAAKAMRPTQGKGHRLLEVAICDQASWKVFSHDEANERHSQSAKQLLGLGSKPSGGMAEAPVTKIKMSSSATSGTIKSVRVT